MYVEEPSVTASVVKNMKKKKKPSGEKTYKEYGKTFSSSTLKT